MSVDSLKAQRRQKKNEIKILSRRADAISKIISSIDSRLDDDVRDINNKISASASGFSAGIKGAGNFVSSGMNDEKESYSDRSVTSCRSSLYNERSRCARRIDQLESSVRSLERQIRDQGGTIYFWE